MKQSFEDYLGDQCPGELQTNNSPEGEDRWIESLDVSDVMDYAQDFARDCFEEGIAKGKLDLINYISPDIRNLERILEHNHRELTGNDE